MSIEVGQWRRGYGSEVWAVMEPHPSRRGYWILVAATFPNYIEVMGRREVEAMPLVSRDYFGGDEHPGARCYGVLRSLVIPDAVKEQA